jgi:hypothetical protein
MAVFEHFVQSGEQKAGILRLANEDFVLFRLFGAINEDCLTVAFEKLRYNGADLL